MAIALAMIVASVLPMPLVFLLRRFQILKVDLDIHQGSIRRNETTASTKEMIDEDDVSREGKVVMHIFPEKILTLVIVLGRVSFRCQLGGKHFLEARRLQRHSNATHTQISVRFLSILVWICLVDFDGKLFSVLFVPYFSFHL